jgi:N-acetylglucosaminyldiphosphoundecaprenol N-acetyl-beta-D-mannosaminyltransferase
VFVALGSPLQERVIAQFRVELPHAWWLGVGISFSLAAGEIRRAPEWMQRLSLEWLHRLVQEPSRLARRYLVDDLPYAIWLLASALLRRLGTRTLCQRQRSRASKHNVPDDPQ